MNKIKFFVMDVDGTLTDGKIYMSATGELFKSFDIKDGCGIKEILPKFDIVPIIITARKSEMLSRRCKELGITELHQGCRNKLEKLEEILNKYSSNHKYTFKNVVYIGDDLLDLKCMIPVKQGGGIIACPSNAISQIKEISSFVSTYKCGEGAIREFIDWYISKLEHSGLEIVQKISEEVFDFICDFDLATLQDGIYKLENGVFANVMSYYTKPVQLTSYESHRTYIDIQYLIFGEELIVTENTDLLSCKITEEYNEKHDIIRYDYDGGTANILKSGNVIILYPNDAHRGAINVNMPCKVRKIVFKVPVGMINKQ